MNYEWYRLKVMEMWTSSPNYMNGSIESAAIAVREQAKSKGIDEQIADEWFEKLKREKGTSFDYAE